MTHGHLIPQTARDHMDPLGDNKNIGRQGVPVGAGGLPGQASLVQRPQASHCANQAGLAGRVRSGDHEPFSLAHSQTQARCKARATRRDEVGLTQLDRVAGRDIDGLLRPEWVCDGAWLLELVHHLQHLRDVRYHSCHIGVGLCQADQATEAPKQLPLQPLKVHDADVHLLTMVRHHFAVRPTLPQSVRKDENPLDHVWQSLLENVLHDSEFEGEPIPGPLQAHNLREALVDDGVLTVISRKEGNGLSAGADACVRIGETRLQQIQWKVRDESEAAGGGSRQQGFLNRD